MVDLARDAVEVADGITLVVFAGISFGRHDDAEHRAGTPFGREVAAFDHGLDQVVEVALEARQHYLCLRVAEAGVELNHLRSAVVQDESAVEHTCEGHALVGHCVGNGLKDCFDGGAADFLGDERHGRIGSHAARVWSGVIVVGTLVVAGDVERVELASVDQTHERELRAVEELLDHHAALAELLVEQHVAQRVFGLAHSEGHDDALAGGESVIFYHNRNRAGLDICKRLVEVAERAVGRSRHAMTRHEILSILFRTLDAGRSLGRAEYLQSLLAEAVDDAEGQRGLRAHDRHVYFILLGESEQSLDVRHGQGNAFGLRGDAGVAGRAVDLRYPFRPGEAVDDGVAASAASYHKNFLSHGRRQCLKWRIPVKSMAMPFSLAFFTESSSRMLPPGCTMAVTP